LRLLEESARAKLLRLKHLLWVDAG
jgi:hypothetical protein